MRRKVKLGRDDTLGGTVPLIMPGKLDMAPGRPRFTRPRRGTGGWLRKIFWFAVIATALVLAARYGILWYQENFV